MRQSFRFAFALFTIAAAGVATSARAEPGVSANEIHIGGTNALTGPIASACSLVSHGALAYFKAVNDKGGIGNRKIRYTLLDDAYSAQRAIANVRRLTTQDEVFAIFGGCGTATAAAALSIVENTPVPYLFPYAGMEALVQPTKKNVFALLPLYSTQVATMLPYVLERNQVKTAAIFSNNVPGNAEWRDAARKVLQARDVTLLADEMIDVTSPERASFVITAKSKNPDLLILVDSAPGAARFFIEMQRQDWTPKVALGTAQMSDESFLRAASGASLHALVITGVTRPASESGSKECSDAMVSYNKDIAPSSFTTYGCLTAKVFVEALRKTGAHPTREGLIRTLESGEVITTGISGPVSFTTTQHMGLVSFVPLAASGNSFKALGDAVSAK